MEEHVEALSVVFPQIPRAVLVLLLSQHNNSVESTTAWLLDHDRDWTNIEEIENSEASETTHSPAHNASNGDIYEEENGPFADAVQEEEEEDQFDIQGYFTSRVAKRPRLYIEGTDEVPDKSKRYWVRFDKRIMLKTHLELINISLKNCAHKSVAVLKTNPTCLNSSEALEQLLRFSGSVNTETSEDLDVGYYAQCYDVDDIDEIWRSMCSALIHSKGQLGVQFEISTCYLNGRSDGFDSVSSRNRSKNGACFVMVPCCHETSTVLEVGKSLVKVLNITPAVLYYRKREQHEADRTFFQVQNQDEHVLASQFKLQVQPIVKTETSTSSKSVERYNWGSSRSSWPPTQEESQFRLCQLSGIVWKPI